MATPAPRGMRLEDAMALAESYQAQLEALDAERRAAAGIEAECEATRRALDALKDRRDGPVLVPLGAGTFVHARLADAETIVTPVGAGVHIAMGADDAAEALAGRAIDARTARGELESAMGRLQAQLETLLDQIRAAQARAGAASP